MPAEGSTPQPKKRSRGRPWQKGQSGNPGGLNSKQRQASDALKQQAAAHGLVLLPDGRNRVAAVLDAVCQHALEGSAPHATLYLNYTVGKPQEHVAVTGDVVLAIRRRVLGEGEQ